MPSISKIQTIPTRKKAISFKSSYYTNFNQKYDWANSQLAKEINTFTKQGDNVEKLGEGVGGEVFRFTTPDLQNFVIKRNKAGHPDSYEKEYKNLFSIPTDKIGGQEAIARVYNPDKGEFYLITSLAQGKPVSATKNPLTAKNLKVLFEKMFELDKLGIYHGDLNGKNVLLDGENGVNFIDYQWTQQVEKHLLFKDQKSKQLMLPISYFPENAQMFEMATLPKYIESLPTADDRINFMRMYLKEKAQYHASRYEYIRKIAEYWPYHEDQLIMGSSICTEGSKAEIFKNPPIEAISLELKKIQFLSDYRDAFSHVDHHLPNRNILASTSSYLCALSSLQDFRKATREAINKNLFQEAPFYSQSLDAYGTYWYNNLIKFTGETHDYVMRTLTKNLGIHEHEHDFYKYERNPRIYKANRDILATMPTPIKPIFDSNFPTSPEWDLKIVKLYAKTLDMLNVNVTDTKALHKVDKFKSLFKEFAEFYTSEKFLDCLNSSQLMVLKLREFNSYLRHYSNKKTIQRIVCETLDNSTTYTNKLFKAIFNSLHSENSFNIITKGYENMRKFKFKL